MMKTTRNRIFERNSHGQILPRLEPWAVGLGLGIAILACMGPQANSGFAQDADVAEEASAWERSASLGLTLTRGNSDTLLLAGSVEAAKEWERNEINLAAFGTYGENDNEKDAETFRGVAQYNRLISERTFGYLRAELFHDGIASIAYRLTLSPGVGYYFIKNETTTLRGEVGPGWVLEKQNGQTTDDYFTLRLAERFTHKLSEKSRLWQSAEILPQVDDFDNYIVNAEVGVESALTERLSLRVVLQDTYDNQPAPGRKTNDLKLISSLAYTF